MGEKGVSRWMDDQTNSCVVTVRRCVEWRVKDKAALRATNSQIASKKHSCVVFERNESAVAASHGCTGKER